MLQTRLHGTPEAAAGVSAASPRRWPRRAHSAAAQPRRSRRARRGDDGQRARAAADDGFRGDERAAEIANAKAEIRRLAPPARPAPDPAAAGPTRSARASTCAPPSARSLRRGGEILSLARDRRVARPAAAGRALRHLRLAWPAMRRSCCTSCTPSTNDRDRVHVFLFGTRLTNITRQLKQRDPEVAFQMVAHVVPGLVGRHADRRGAGASSTGAGPSGCWARAPSCCSSPTGWTGTAAAGLAENMDRLHRSCSRLIWLNPLLRWEGFQPKSQGIRAMLPHVDEFRTGP